MTDYRRPVPSYELVACPTCKAPKGTMCAPRGRNGSYRKKSIAKCRCCKQRKLPCLFPTPLLHYTHAARRDRADMVRSPT